MQTTKVNVLLSPVHEMMLEVLISFIETVQSEKITKSETNGLRAQSATPKSSIFLFFNGHIFKMTSNGKKQQPQL